MKEKIIAICLGIFTLISLLFIQVGETYASKHTQDAGPGIVSDTYCLSCHDTPGLRTELPSGEDLYIGIDPQTYYSSVHGELGYACTQCHVDIRTYPHPENTASSIRDYTIQRYENCRRCHEGMYEATMDSTHQQALEEGNKEAAVCTDCHGAHNVTVPDEPRSNIPKMCQRCHSIIYELYEESVHGEALIGEGNPDVPTCTDCHGVHQVSGPSTEDAFHLFSPQICAECHADEALMEKYGISTNVFETYISDFHGTTVLLFEKTAPDQETNKPVCIDCHGVHDMKQVDDPESQVIQENLLTTCQKCHPDASESFPTSWLGHYKPSRDEHPLIFFVDLFYKIIIPVTIGGMIVFITTDIGNKIKNKLDGRK